jgi:tetratricopeptide (TPR) repeat protein
MDLGALASGWLKPHGGIGWLALGGLAFAGYVLSQAQNRAALLGGDRKRPDPPRAPKHHHHTPHNLPDRTISPDRFVGRAAELQRLAALLAPESSRVVLTGMGGVGKSELASQHACDALARYQGGIVRLDARQGLAAMASQLVLFFRRTFPAVRLPDDKSPIELLRMCWSQWPAVATPPEPVLLILDDQPGDAEGYAAERQLFAGLPPRFRRLLTQREPAPTGAKALALSLLQREASLELMCLHAGEGGFERLQAESRAADGLCAEVGDLPLALVLLGARLKERPDLRLSLLLEEVRAKGAEAKALQQAHPELGVQRGVVEALLISWEALSPAAKSLGVLLSVMAPAVIPWELVEACRLPEQVQGSALGEQLSELRRAQLVERLGEGLYRLHPLVRQFIRLQSENQSGLAARWRGQLGAAAAQVCREQIPQTLTQAQVDALERVLPHIRQVAEEGATGLSEEDLIETYMGLARVAMHQAVYGEARRWCKQGLAECDQRLTPEHPYIATARHTLAQLLKDINRLAEAEPRMARVVELFETSFGNEQTNVAAALNNLAMLLGAHNRLEEAEPLMRRNVAILIASLQQGVPHPNLEDGVNNYVGLLQQLGYSEAEIQAKLESLQPETNHTPAQVAQQSRLTPG